MNHFTRHTNTNHMKVIMRIILGTAIVLWSSGCSIGKKELNELLVLETVDPL